MNELSRRAVLRRARLLATAVLLMPALACDDSRTAERRRAEVERSVAEAEGGTGGQPPPRPSAPLAITPESAAAPPPPAADPPSPQAAAWASAITRAIDAVGTRSAQTLTVQLLRAAGDPRQKSQELTASMQWCDEGSLDACLHVGHVLLFNECLFDRARGFYEKARALADGLPAPAIDHFTVDGQPQRQELAVGLRFSDPANRDDQQVRAVDAVCGAIAERDRPLWDALFASYEAGAITGATSAATGSERVALGAIRKKMLLELQERVAALEGLHAGAAAPLPERLFAAAHDLCGEGDPVSCATASFLASLRCDLPRMEEDYRRYQSALSTLDAASQAQAVGLSSDVLGAVRGYLEGDEKMRDLLRKSLCAGRHAVS